MEESSTRAVVNQLREQALRIDGKADSTSMQVDDLNKAQAKLYERLSRLEKLQSNYAQGERA